MSIPKIAVHTDVILEYLFARREDQPVLRKAMKTFFCYVTVFHAIELFAVAGTERERRNIEDVLSCMKILGMNAKGAKRYAAMLSAKNSQSVLNLLVAGLCIESKLPLLTGQPELFRGIPGLQVVPSSQIRTGRMTRRIPAATRSGK